MIYRLLFFTCFCIEGCLLAQKQPIDTVFYDDGLIHYIRYKDSYAGGDASIKYFKKSNNPLDWNQPLRDTIYWNNKAQQKWTWYGGTTAISFNRDACVVIDRRTKYGSNRDSVFYKMPGRYMYFFKEFDYLKIELFYGKDTLIGGINVGQTDTLHKWGYKQRYHSSAFNGTNFSTEGSKTGNLYQCGSSGMAELWFSNSNLLNGLTFYPSDTNKFATCYEFHDNFLCKAHGYKKYNINLHVGEWMEYHRNGNLKSIGTYELIRSEIEDKYFKEKFLESKKVGVWQYFSENGKLLKKETWDKGKLIATKEYEK